MPEYKEYVIKKLESSTHPYLSELKAPTWAERPTLGRKFSLDGAISLLYNPEHEEINPLVCKIVELTTTEKDVEVNVKVKD